MRVLLNLPAPIIAAIHTGLAISAFAVSLGLGYFAGLWKALCENSVARWPVEWWPSVSATIGDHAPSRAPFHLVIALTAAPRFILLTLQWMAHRYPPRPTNLLSAPASNLPASVEPKPSASSNEGRTLRSRTRGKKDSASPDPDPQQESTPDEDYGSSTAEIEFCVGLARTLCCGGWMFITSRDHHDLHDLFMIVYLVLNLPWMVLSTVNSTNAKTRKWRLAAGGGFVASIGPLIWLFYRHSVLRIPGAYTYYSLVEWSLVFWDVLFDAAAIQELDHLTVMIGDRSRLISAESSDLRFRWAKVPGKAVESVEDWTDAKNKEEAPQVGLWRAVGSYLSDLWFVWKLALSGSEIALLANLSPLALGIKSYRRFSTSRIGLLTHRSILYFGLASFAIPSVTARLLVVFGAMWSGWNSVVGDVIRMRGSLEAVAEARVLISGLLITMVLKYWNHSNNPFWPVVNLSSGGWNLLGLALSAIALTEYYYRPLTLFPAQPISTSNPSTFSFRQYGLALGLGALIHLIQTFATDAGTIIAWTWSGYPTTGPTLHPYGGILIFVVATGCLIFNTRYYPSIISSVVGTAIWSIHGAIGLFGLFYKVSGTSKADWIAYWAGILLVIYLLTILPMFLQAASMNPVRILGVALSVNCVLDVASVFTVAYAFVPFGWLLRERTDVVLGFCIAAILLGVSCLDFKLSQPQLKLRSVERIKRVSSFAIVTSIIIAISGLGIGFYKSLTMKMPQPYFPDHKIFIGGIWTVHFGIDEAGYDSQRRLAELVEDMQVDVLGLLETDLHRFVYGNRDLTRYMAEELGYYVDLGPGPNQHTWGAALLSKFPILNSTHHLLPSPNGELAPAIFATLDVHGQNVNVLVSHNGQEEDPLDRELQTRELARLLRSTADTPTIFLGYLVTHVGDKAPAPYQILFEDGGIYDIEKEDRWRWCEYIGFRGLWRIAFARLDHGDVTDTELQVGKFMLPLPDHSVVYEDDKELYWHIGEEDIPPPWRMTRLYRVPGARGHFYRVWDGPLYYLPPERSHLRDYGWDSVKETE